MDKKRVTKELWITNIEQGIINTEWFCFQSLHRSLFVVRLFIIPRGCSSFFVHYSMFISLSKEKGTESRKAKQPLHPTLREAVHSRLGNSYFH